MQRNWQQNFRDFGLGLGGIGIFCLGTNCTGSPANAGNQQQPQYYPQQPQYYPQQPQYYPQQPQYYNRRY